MNSNKPRQQYLLIACICLPVFLSACASTPQIVPVQCPPYPGDTTRTDATTADPVPAAGCEKLAEDAAQTTLMVVEFQRWYWDQREAANSRGIQR